MESTNKTQIHLTDVQKTLPINLYAKAIDNRSKKPILHDTKADEVVRMTEASQHDSFATLSFLIKGL